MTYDNLIEILRGADAKMLDRKCFKMPVCALFTEFTS